MWLIVDDDELVRARLAALLKIANFHVEVAGSGEDAIRVMRDAPCQIVLTDWQMPDMDGIALCRYLRTSMSDSYIYVLMLTVRDAKQDVLDGLAAGADDYVSKLAPIEEILARVQIGRRITQVEQSLRNSNRENRRLAITDALTGVHNLRYVMNNLPRELARSRRYGHPLAILSCDIDDFKQVNDRFGHASGDLVLQAFVARSSNALRKASDWMAAHWWRRIRHHPSRDDVIGVQLQSLASCVGCWPHNPCRPPPGLSISWQASASPRST